MKNSRAQRIPWEQIESDLLEKYSGPAPRYTSYPTAPEWSGDVTTGQFREALARAAVRAEDPLSIYVHIPYCKQRCRFCGCASWVSNATDEYDRYLDALEVEIASQSEQLGARGGVAQLHLGGGTPTVLDPTRLERLMNQLRRHFSLWEDAEVSIEIAPAVTTLEQIDTLAALGFNRVSMGVQDFTPEVQQAVNRVQSIDLTRGLIKRARSRGIDGINIDLMYGLPKQKPKTWQETLKVIIELNPDRLAVFGYAHVPWMRPHQKEIDESDLPDTDQRLELFKLAYGRLLDAGYVHIGMDHFARENDELALALEQGRLSRNFQGYTVRHASELIGLGATAISDIGHTFAQNQVQLAPYKEAIARKGMATFRGLVTSEEDRLRRYVITELMCNLTLDIKRTERQFGISFSSHFASELERLIPLVDDGLVARENDCISVTPKGRLFVRHVGLAFDSYSTKPRKDGPRFSKTV